MKKIIFSFSNQHKGYIVEEKFRTKIYQLGSLKKVLQVVDAWRIDIKNIGSVDELIYEGIECEYMSKLEQVWIWCAFFIKEQEYKKFQTIEESIAYDDKYEEYYDKRWEETPKVKISINDWQELQEKWKLIKKELPQYLIFTLDDSESTDKIEIFGKNELSPEDVQNIKIEHEKYLKYQRAKQKYIDSHSDYSDIWRGPQDDEYETDIMKYYDN